jgi:hypothetical protein
LTLLHGPAQAQQGGSAYTINDISISKAATTGQQARELGLAEARQAAFAYLYDRLVPQGYASARPNLTPPELDGLVAAVDVVRERTTATAYTADLAITFSQPRVRQLLTARRIPFTDRVSPPLLLLPVYEWAGARQLWEVPNPWHSAWTERVGANGLTTTVMARGGAEEQLQLSADQAVSGDSPGLQQLANAYGAGGAVVALGQFRVDPRTGTPMLEVTMRGYGAAPAGPITQSFSGSTGGRAGLAAEQLTRTAAEAMAVALAEAWKTENLRRADSGGGNSLRVSVPLTYIGDYANALRRIAEVKTLSSAVLAKLTTGVAEFQLSFGSNLDQVRREFDQYGMRLVQQPGGWVLHING